MGIFDKPQVRDGDLRDLMNAPFRLVGAGTREVQTIYGKNTAIDLHVDIDGEVKIYSGFAAGIKRQVDQAVPGDFPTDAIIRELPLGEGKTTLELAPASEFSPVSDDDIPF